MKIGVAGAGTMGAGIAQACAIASHDVWLQDVSGDARERGMKSITASLERLGRKGHLTDEQRAEALSRVTLVGDWDHFAEADVVIEAVYEDERVKHEVWSAIDAVTPANTILASNTSSLSITQLASYVSRPERFCGLHFFNPVPVLKLVEVVRGAHTSDETIAAAKAFAEGIGKTPIVCEDKPGFIVNRLLIPYINEAIHALTEGVASPEDIDTAMKLGANMPIGPLALGDLVGLDVVLAATESLQRETGDPKFRPSPLLRQLVRAGKLGRKSGTGIFPYDS